MTQTEIERKILCCADEVFAECQKIAADLMEIPEAGYFEEKTSAYIRKVMEQEGLTVDRVAHTGVRGSIGSGQYNVCVMGELDAILTRDHPGADPVTGMAHACGHNAQMTVMLGVLKTLKRAGVCDALAGKISFIGVPAEECIQLDKRRELIKDGKIKYLSGKQQLIYEGVTDDIDCCMMVHALGDTAKPLCDLQGSSMGFFTVQVTFKGRASHAAAAPFDGINALDTAVLAMMNIHANRATFRESDRVRIHPIITKGGDVVNVVPAEVVMETQVRAMTLDGMKGALDVTLRAIKGACVAMGAQAEVKVISGYMPMEQDKRLSALFMDCAAEHGLLKRENMNTDRDMLASTDFGDLSLVLPTIQPLIGGTVGSLHSRDFCLQDENTSLLVPIKVFSLMIARLLRDGGKEMERVKSAFKPAFTREEYLAFLDRNNTTYSF